MAINNPDKSFITLDQGGKHRYRGNLPKYFNPRSNRVKINMVIYHSIFYNIGTRELLLKGKAQ